MSKIQEALNRKREVLPIKQEEYDDEVLPIKEPCYHDEALTIKQNESEDDLVAEQRVIVATIQTSKNNLYTARALKTIVLLTAIVLLGMAYSLFGSTFVDLEQLFQCDARAISLSMSISGVGLIAASLIAIFKLNKLSPELSMILSLISISIITSMWTAVRSIYWYLGLAILHGFCNCLFISEMQPYFLQLWENHRLQKPVMLSIFGLMTFGVALGPFIITPFLAHHNTSLPHHQPSLTGAGYTGDAMIGLADHNNSAIDSLISLVSSRVSSRYNVLRESYQDPGRDDAERVTVGYPHTTQFSAVDVRNVSGTAHPVYTGNVQLAFVVLGLPLLAPTLLYAIICLRTKASLLRVEQPRVEQEPCEDDKHVTTMSSADRRILIILTLVFYMFNAISEFTPITFFTLFVDRLLGWVPPRSTIINSAFNAGVCVGCLVGIPLSYSIKPRTQVVVNLIIIFTAASLLLLARLDDLVVWFGAALLGFGVSTVFSTMLLWLSENVKVTNRIMASILISYTMGTMLGPLVTGQLFVLISPLSMACMVIFSSSMTIIIYVILCVLERRRPSATRRLVIREQNGL